MLTKQDSTVLRVLLIFTVLAAVPVLLGGFVATMTTLWVMCIILCIIFQSLLWKDWGAQSFPLSWLVRLGAKNGTTVQQVYRRGRNVTALMIFIIPALASTAK